MLGPECDEETVEVVHLGPLLRAHVDPPLADAAAPPGVSPPRQAQHLAGEHLEKCCSIYIYMNITSPLLTSHNLAGKQHSEAVLIKLVFRECSEVLLRGVEGAGQEVV